MNTETDHERMIGAVLAARYRIEALIGEGAMGAVYRARHVKVGRPFAIKVLHPRFSGEERTRKRFAREAEVAGTLHHANVVSVVDVGELTDGRRFLVMEYAEGVTLLDLINETAPMSPARVISLIRQLCAGLQHAHELGLIHRDFKPDNIIVERDRHGTETPRIVDFGTAILREDAVSPGAERLTTQGLVLGTPHYMSPEHATGQPIDHRIDLFALGVTCFEMMTGHSPYEGDGVDVARANLLLDTPVMNVRVPGLLVDPLLEAFTRKLMMKSRDDRPATAAAARELIDLINHDRSAAAAALGVPLDEPPPRPAVNPRLVSPPIPFEVGPSTPPIDANGAPGWPAPAPMPWPVPPTQPAWQPAGRSPSSPPASDPTSSRLRSQPEATEQIAQMQPRSRSLRFIIPAIAAAVVLVTMVVAVRGRQPKPKVVEFSSLRTGRTAPPPTATASGITPPSIAPPPAPSEPAAVPAPAPTAVAAVAPISAARRPADTAAPPVAPHVAADAKLMRTGSAAAPRATRTPAMPAVPSAADRASDDAKPTMIAMPITATGVAELYASVGRQLKALDEAQGPAATAGLWPLYLRIHINNVISDPSKLADASTLLYQIEDQVSRRSPGAH